MELITPALGLVVWTTITFLLLLFLLKSFAWKPILQALKDRENTISDALSSAEKARTEIAKLQSDNEKLLAEARLERDKILQTATATANNIVEGAKAKAEEEGSRLLEQAREAISHQKNAAITELRNSAAALSIEIAEKLLRHELKNTEAQAELVKSYIKESKLN